VVACLWCTLPRRAWGVLVACVAWLMLCVCASGGGDTTRPRRQTPSAVRHTQTHTDTHRHRHTHTRARMRKHTCRGTMAGRRFANALRPARRPSSPRSGRCSAGSVSHLYLRAVRAHREWAATHVVLLMHRVLRWRLPPRGGGGILTRAAPAFRPAACRAPRSSTRSNWHHHHHHHHWHDSQAAHPPMAASSTESQDLHTSSVSAGSGDPVASMAAPPMSASRNSNSCPSALPAAVSTLSAAFMISGPMPSPGSTATLCAAAATTRHAGRLLLLKAAGRWHLGLPPSRQARCEDASAMVITCTTSGCAAIGRIVPGMAQPPCNLSVICECELFDYKLLVSGVSNGECCCHEVCDLLIHSPSFSRPSPPLTPHSIANNSGASRTGTQATKQRACAPRGCRRRAAVCSAATAAAMRTATTAGT
jgi:hypothetical protein